MKGSLAPSASATPAFTKKSRPLVSWVVEPTLEHGVQAPDIAILSATPEPYGALLRAHLAALPWPQEHDATASL